MKYLEEEFPFLWIMGLVIVSVYPILAIELLFSNFSGFAYLAAAIEEIVKSIIIVYFIINKKPSPRNALLYGVVAGVTFGFIENLLYAIRFVPSPDFALIILNRFFQPFLVHITASVVFAVLAQRKYPLIGVIFAIGIHMIYNHFVLLGI